MNDAIAAILSIAAFILVAVADAFAFFMGALGGLFILLPWVCGVCCGIVGFYYSFLAECWWVKIASWLMILLTVAAIAFGFALPSV